MRKFTMSVLMITASLAVAGCATRAEPVVEVFKYAAPGTIAPYKSAAVFNFKLEDTHKGEGPNLGDLAAEALVREGFAQRTLRVDQFVESLPATLAWAREKPVDAVVYGTIDEYFYGGRTSLSRISFTLHVVDPATSAELWRVVGRASQPPAPPTEKYFYVDVGAAAPLPMVLGRQAMEAVAKELTGHTAPPVPKESVAPKNLGEPTPY